MPELSDGYTLDRVVPEIPVINPPPQPWTVVIALTFRPKYKPQFKLFIPEWDYMTSWDSLEELLAEVVRVVESTFSLQLPQ